MTYVSLVKLAVRGAATVVFHDGHLCARSPRFYLLRRRGEGGGHRMIEFIVYPVSTAVNVPQFITRQAAAPAPRRYFVCNFHVDSRVATKVQRQFP